MYLMPLTCTLEMVKVATFCVCITSHTHKRMSWCLRPHQSPSGLCFSCSVQPTRWHPGPPAQRRPWVSVLTWWAGRSRPPLGTAPPWECDHGHPEAWRTPTRARPRPPRRSRSPANGFFCVSTPQITMAKLRGKRAGQCLRARPSNRAQAPTRRRA